MRYFIANWKAYVDSEDTAELAASYKEAKGSDTCVVICPDFVDIVEAAKAVKGSMVKVGAQDCAPEDEGAYTGQVSPKILREHGVSYVIVGHSETRARGVTDADVHQKVGACLANALVPVVCVGETYEERQAGKAEEVVRKQIEGALSGITLVSGYSLIVVYEPVWAISANRQGEPITMGEIERMVGVARTAVATRPANTAGKHVVSLPEVHVPILYGGSVSPENIAEILVVPGVDGVLVGRASTEIWKVKQLLSHF